MMRKLRWLALAVALTAPMAAAWAGDGKAGNGATAGDPPSCSCPKSCPKACPKPCPTACPKPCPPQGCPR
jgi:hypothetical protein